MAAPSYDSKRFGISWNATRTAHPAFTPGTKFDRGDLIIVLIGTNGTPSFSTASSGWTELAEDASSTYYSGAMYYKIAEGHGNDDLSITTTSSVYSSIMTIVISGGGTPISASTDDGFSDAPNSPNHSMGSSDDYLWLSAVVIGGTQVTQTAPTNYTKRYFVERTTANPPNLIIADDAVTATSENPGAWSVTSTDYWVAFTVGISPYTPASDDYGMKCWDASGDLTIDSTERLTALVAAYDATADTDGNSGSLSEINGRSTFCLGIAKESGGESTEQAPHRVYRSSNTIYWEERENASYDSVDTHVLVFVFE